MSNSVPDGMRRAVIDATLNRPKPGPRAASSESRETRQKPSATETVGCPLCGESPNLDESSSRYTKCSGCGSMIRSDYWSHGAQQVGKPKAQQSLSSLLSEALQHHDSVMSGAGEEQDVVNEMRRRLNS